MPCRKGVLHAACHWSTTASGLHFFRRKREPISGIARSPEEDLMSKLLRLAVAAALVMAIGCSGDPKKASKDADEARKKLEEADQKVKDLSEQLKQAKEKAK